MRPIFPTLIVVSGALLSAYAAQARDVDQYSRNTNNRPYFARAKAITPQRPLSTMDLTPRKPLARPYGEMSTPMTGDRVPTAVSYRVSPGGPVGSVGLVDLGGSHAIDPAFLSNAVADRGAPSRTIGAQLAYNFR